MIRLTPEAARFVRAVMARANLSGDVSLRVGLSHDGCDETFTEYRYKLTCESNVTKPDDMVFESEEIRILVNAENLRHLDGLEIGVREKLGGLELTFQNPHARRSCGCGLTFSVEESNPQGKDRAQDDECISE